MLYLSKKYNDNQGTFLAQDSIEAFNRSPFQKQVLIPRNGHHSFSALKLFCTIVTIE